MKKRAEKAVRELLSSVAVVTLALVVGGLFIALSGNRILESYGMLLRGAFGSTQRITEVFVKMVPILIMSLGISVAFRAKLWNIGADGQMLVGSILAAAAGIYLPGPSVLVFLAAIAASMLGGGLWAGLAGALKTRFNANEVITTLMLNYAAVYLLAYCVYGPLQEPGGYNYPQSSEIGQSLRLLPLVPGTRLNAGIFAALIVVFFMMLFWKSKKGFQVDLLGQGMSVARYAGLRTSRAVIGTMMLSGALAGLAGWTEVFGIHYRLLEGIGRGYGDLAVVVALLGKLSPVGTVIASFLFAVLLVGGASMQRMTDIPYSIVDIIQGVIILFILAKSLFETRLKWPFARREREHTHVG